MDGYIAKVISQEVGSGLKEMSWLHRLCWDLASYTLSTGRFPAF